MLYWCIKNSVVVICFTVLAIVFDTWWIALFGVLFMSNYKEIPNETKENKEYKE